MTITTRNQQHGYSSSTPQKYLKKEKPTYSISTTLEPQQSFEDGKPTGEIIAYKAWFVQEGLPPFQVKFSEMFELPKFMSIVEFDNLEGCEVRYKVYFRANGIKEVK